MANTSKIQIYCSALYSIMDRDSATVELGDGTKVKVWKGSLVKESATVGAGEGVYTRVIERLTALGCIDVLEKGRRNIPSTVALHYPPTAEVWAQKISPEALTSRPSPATLQAELESLRKGMEGIDVKSAIKNLDDRLIIVEQQLARMQAK